MKPETYISLALCAAALATSLMPFASFWTPRQSRLQPQDSLGGALSVIVCDLLSYFGRFFLSIGKDAKPLGFGAIWIVYSSFSFSQALPLMVLSFTILCYGYFVSKKTMGESVWNEAI